MSDCSHSKETPISTPERERLNNAYLVKHADLLSIYTTVVEDYPSSIEALQKSLNGLHANNQRMLALLDEPSSVYNSSTNDAPGIARLKIAARAMRDMISRINVRLQKRAELDATLQTQRDAAREHWLDFRSLTSELGACMRIVKGLEPLQREEDIEQEEKMEDE